MQSIIPTTSARAQGNTMRPVWNRCAIALCCVFLSVVAVALAPTVARADDSDAVTPELRTEIIEKSIELLDELYVIPETAELVAIMLRENLAAGAYDVETTKESFAAAVTQDMQDLTNDKHLRIGWGNGGGARRMVRRVGGAPGSGAPGSGAPDTGGTDGGVFANRRGIPSARMLPGNVGYVDIRLFVPLELQKDDAVNAMATVADADAVIFDLRTCMGGTPEMVHFITSYFYPPEPMHLLTYYRANAEPDSAYTLAEVPGKRRPDVDVWILISEFTGSGCEEFSYNLKHHDRATLVGQKTAGAGHGGSVHELPSGFNIFVPKFRPVHPKTGGGWEAVGVVPDIECDSEKALPVAHKLALEKILDRGPALASSANLRSLVADLDAQLARADEPEAIDPKALAEYAGDYDNRTIFLEDDGLWLQRQGGPKLKMVSADEPEVWSLKRVPQARIKFVRGADGSIRELQVLGMQGTWETSKRR